MSGAAWAKFSGYARPHLEHRVVLRLDGDRPVIHLPNGTHHVVSPPEQAPTRTTWGGQAYKDDCRGVFRAHALAEREAEILGVPLVIVGLPERPVRDTVDPDQFRKSEAKRMRRRRQRELLASQESSESEEGYEDLDF